MLNWLSVCAAVLEDIVDKLRGKYPHLTINYVPATVSAWVVIHRPDMAVYSSDRPPVYDPHLVLTVVDGNVLYDFRALSQSITKGLFSWELIESHLNSLLPCSAYALCPGVKEYPSTVHFESKRYVHIVTPYERHQSSGCKLWHVPKNRQHQPGSVLFNVCDSCKVLHNHLETLRKRHNEFSPRKRASWKLPSSKRPLKYCSPLTGTCIMVL